jgi:lipid-binding SYLF domain-containing protein
MKTARNLLLALLLTTAPMVTFGTAAPAAAATAQDLDKDAQQALHALYRTNPLAEKLSHSAKAVLVFPNIVKAGLIFGGSYGEGELLRGGTVDGYFNSVSASWGLQAGAQSYGYVMFLMTNDAVAYVHDTHGWEIGVGPTVVIVDEGAAKNISTSTQQDAAYAFIFDQQGLMASLSIEGSKISKIRR